MSEIPEELKERARWEIKYFERPSVETSKMLLRRVEELEAHVDRIEDHAEYMGLRPGESKMAGILAERPKFPKKPCLFHCYDQEACEKYSGDVPCEPCVCEEPCDG